MHLRVSSPTSSQGKQCHAPRTIVYQAVPVLIRLTKGAYFQGRGSKNLIVTGDSYLDVAYDYHRADMWRNFGPVVVFLVVYTALSALSAELFAFPEGNQGSMQFIKTPRSKVPAAPCSAGTSRRQDQEKLAYVDTILRLLELETVQDAGLICGREQRLGLSWSRSPLRSSSMDRPPQSIASSHFRLFTFSRNSHMLGKPLFALSISHR